jgi:CheY-like chemotaxis protein
VSRSPAVLCIDDNVLGLAVRKAMLESLDYRVFTAENGPAGLEIVAREQIDLVVLDYEMPEMDGGRVAQQLRKQHAGIPILLLTGFPGRIPEWLLAVVDGFVVKGSPPHAFLQEVERITSAPPVARQQVVASANGRRKRPREPRELPEQTKRLLKRCRQKRKR